MRKRKLLFTLLALASGAFLGGSGAMAQSTNGWEKFTSQGGTSTPTWTAITSGSTTGKVLGSANSTSYYYVKDTYTFSNTTAGGSGLTILGTVYLYLPAGKSITCTGANASGATGAGAGIELAAGNTLYIIGGGTSNNITSTVTAQGGNAANGSDGGAGTNADGDNGNSWTRTGTGGRGGDGGGGAGAGIGTRGGTGGTGGSGGAGYKYDDGKQDDPENGTDGSDGTAGASALAMGTLYVANGITVNATGGAAGTSGGAGGQRGKSFAYDGSSWNVTTGAGGGGGGGGFGGAASNIGTGGRGGGGGGGGCGGAQDDRSNSLGGVYCVDADGGKGGQNADGNYAGNGTDADTNGSAHANGWLYVANGSFNTSSDWNTASGDAKFGSPGSGGNRGTNDTSAGTQHATDNEHNLWYTITCHHTMPSVSDEVIMYSPSTGASVVLPATYNDTYQWALGIYGKDCGATREPNEKPSVFTTATQEFYGGGTAATANRTIYLPDVYGNLEFYEVRTICILENNSSNVQEINDFYVADVNPNADAPKWPITVRLKDRKLYKDGDWNTICLPFDITPEQYEDSPLAGATIKKLSATYSGYWPDGGTIGTRTYNYPVIFLNFEDAEPGTYGLQRGKPYLVSWEYGTDLVDNTTEVADAEDDKIEDPSVVVPELKHQLDFNYVTVKSKATGAGSWEGNANNKGKVTFTGTFTPVEVQGSRYLILGQYNTLYYPSSALSVAACRGFFTITNQAANAAPEIVMGFDDGETTSIQVVNGSGLKNQGSDTYYNLNGQRVAQPTKGLYIVNGKKVIVK